MTPELGGRHALITGGSGGIGNAVAAALAGHGANVTIAGRNAARLRASADTVPAAFAVTVDVRDSGSVGAAFKKARERFGPVDILVNAAGVAPSARFLDMAAEQWLDAVDVNLHGTFLCCREALAPMLESGFGRIVNIASTAGLRGYRYVTAYCAAKHGIVGLTRALALETAARGVTVNAVCPGYTETTMLEETVANIIAKTGRSVDEARGALLRDIPRGSFVHAAEVANAVAWLCLPGAAAVTGQAIAVDGGETAG